MTGGDLSLISFTCSDEKTVNKAKSEMVIVGGACLLSPVVGYAVMMLLTTLVNGPLWPITAGMVIDGGLCGRLLRS